MSLNIRIDLGSVIIGICLVVLIISIVAPEQARAILEAGQALVDGGGG